MAKTQTFGDKTKKKKDDKVTVKVIKAYRSDIGSTKFLEKFVKIDDIAQIEKVDVNR